MKFGIAQYPYLFVSRLYNHQKPAMIEQLVFVFINAVTNISELMNSDVSGDFLTLNNC